MNRERVPALEVAPGGVGVNAVAPGEVSTPMTGQHDVDPATANRPGIPLGRPASAYEVAAAVVFFCGTNASFMTGQSFVVDGGLLLRPPKPIADALMRAAATIILWVATLVAIFWGMTSLVLWTVYGERYRPRSSLGHPGVALALLLWGVLFQGLLLMRLY